MKRLPSAPDAASGKAPAAPAADDAALFRAAVKDVTRLVNERVRHAHPKPAAIPRQRWADEQAALAESIEAPALPDLYLEGGDEPAFLRPGAGLGRDVLRDLRRGRWVAQAQLDLHGMNRHEAHMQTGLFLGECLALGERCVRIVHGKGLGSPGREPVLKNLLLGWLARRREVLAFCQARPAQGGAGALLVLLADKRHGGGRQ